MKKFKTFFVFFLTAAVFLSLAACSQKKAGEVVYPYESGSASVSQPADEKYYTSQSSVKSLEKIGSAGTSLLYFDKTTCAVSVYDLNARTLWCSLPDTYRGGQPSVVSLRVVAGGKLYTLSSQTDSVAVTGTLYEKGENSITVNYGFRKTLEKGTRISLTVPVVFEVNQGVLSVSVDCGKIENEDNSDNVIVESVSLLGYFGSGHTGSEGDFLLVPDGCGALLDLSEPAKKTMSVSVPVYSPDYAANRKDGSYLAKVPCFAVKSKSAAFAAVVEKGDALCTLNVERASQTDGYNRVGATFSLAGITTDQNAKTVTVSDSAYTGEIRISYRFLSGDAADYAGIAAACREALTRNGVLNFSSGSELTDMPLILQLSGSDYDKQSGKLTTLTSFNEAQEILSLLRAKGIGRIYLRYCGMFSDGPLQSPDSTLKLSSLLGTKKQFNELLHYASSQNIKVFADVNLVSGKDTGKKTTATSLGSETAEAAYKSLTSFSDTLTTGLLKPREIENGANSIISYGRKMNLDGICLSDAGRLLYSDFSAGSASDRQAMRSVIAAQSDAVSSGRLLMVNSPAVYTLKYASVAVNLPDSSALATLDGAQQIPFLQILLHGLCDYAGKPLNLYKNFETGLLRAVEYGEVPSFTLTYKDCSDQNGTDSYFYMNSASNAQLAYERMSAVLSGLSGKTITDHYKVKSKVYCTEYGGNIRVYVNYRDTDVTVNGITVGARDFVRVG